MSQSQSNKYICGNCDSEDVVRSQEYDFVADVTMFKIRCNHCKFYMQMPIPRYSIDDPSFNAEFELHEKWDMASARAKPPSRSGEIASIIPVPNRTQAEWDEENQHIANLVDKAINNFIDSPEFISRFQDKMQKRLDEAWQEMNKTK